MACVPTNQSFIAGNQAGFKYFSTSFARAPETKADLDIELPVEMRIHIVSKLPDQCRGHGYEACAYPDGRVYVLGKTIDGKIVLNQAILGHELMHLLNWKNPKIADPDTLY